MSQYDRERAAREQDATEAMIRMRTPDEHRLDRHKRTLDTLWTLIADLSAGLTDEEPAWSLDGLQALRRRVANALPPDRCPDWLQSYRDPSVVTS